MCKIQPPPLNNNHVSYQVSQFESFCFICWYVCSIYRFGYGFYATKWLLLLLILNTVTTRSQRQQRAARTIRLRSRNVSVVKRNKRVRDMEFAHGSNNVMSAWSECGMAWCDCSDMPPNIKYSSHFTDLPEICDVILKTTRTDYVI